LFLLRGGEVLPLCNIESFIQICFEFKSAVLRHPFHCAIRFLGEHTSCVVEFTNSCQNILRNLQKLMMDISDTELKKRLEAYNVDVPPITYTTRDLLIRKLLKLDSSEQTSRNIQSNQSVDRKGRPILESTPSVTFSPNDETIDGYDYDYPEEHQSEEYFSKNNNSKNQLKHQITKI